MAFDPTTAAPLDAPTPTSGFDPSSASIVDGFDPTSARPLPERESKRLAETPEQLDPTRLTPTPKKPERKRMAPGEQAAYDRNIRPEKGLARQMLLKDLEELGYLSSVTASATGTASKTIRKENGEWVTPQAARTAPEGSGKAAKFASGLGNLAQTLAAQVGAKSTELTPIIERARRTHNLSDEDIQDVWRDIYRANRKWEKKEPTRVLSDGTLLLNPAMREILDPEKVRDYVEESKTSTAAKDRVLAQYDQMRQDIASARLAAYEAAASAQNTGGKAARGAARSANLGIAELGRAAIPGKTEDLLSPSEWAKQNDRLGDLNTPEFIQDYEREVLDKQGKVGAYVRSLAADAVLGWNKVAVTGLGLAGFAGIDAAGEAAAAGQEAESMVMQGKENTGLVGAVVREAPSVAAQMVTAPGAGLAAGATASLARTSAATATRVATLAGRSAPILTAGAQSAGMEYASAIGEGLSEEEARDRSIIAGINTSVVTGIFSGLKIGAVEDVAAGKGMASVTVGDIFRAGTKQEMWANTRTLVKDLAKDYIGEASEEAIDQITGAFLNATPDTNLATAWTEAWEAGKVGGVMGAGVKGAQAIISPSQQASEALLTPEVAETAPAAAEAAREVAPVDLGGAETAEDTRPEISRTGIQQAASKRRFELEQKRDGRIGNADPDLGPVEADTTGRPLSAEEEAELDALVAAEESGDYDILAEDYGYRIKSPTVVTEQAPEEISPTGETPTPTETPETDGLEPSTQPTVTDAAPETQASAIEAEGQTEAVGGEVEVGPDRVERPDEKIRRRVLDKMRMGQELTKDEQAAADAELKWAAETQQLPADSPELQDPETFKTWKSARNNINDAGFVAADQGSLDRTVELHRALTLKGDTETADRMLERAKTTPRKETNPAKIKQESEKKGDPLTDSEAAEIAATNTAFNQRVNAAIAAMDQGSPETTAPEPTLSREGLKDAFDLTDEQAETAESMARALGLSPERVLLARERGVKVEQVTPEMVAERVGSVEAAVGETTAEPDDVQTATPDAQQTTLSDTDAGQPAAEAATETPTTQPRNRTGVKALDTLNSDERVTEITKDKKSGLITAKMADGTEVTRKSAVMLKKALVEGQTGESVTETTASQEPVTETPSDVTGDAPQFTVLNPPKLSEVGALTEGMDDDTRLKWVRARVSEMEAVDPNIGREWDSPYGRQRIRGIAQDGGALNLTDPIYEVDSVERPGEIRRYSAKSIEETIKSNEYAISPEAAAERVKVSESARMAQERAKEDAAEEEAAKQRMAPYLDAATNTPLQRGKKQAALLESGSRSTRAGKAYRGNKFDVTQEMVNDGYLPTSEEVARVKDISSRRFNRMDGAEQRAFERRRKEAGTKTEYYLEKEGSQFKVTKTEHDLAQWMVGNAEQVPPAVKPTAKAEPAPTTAKPQPAPTTAKPQPATTAKEIKAGIVAAAEAELAKLPVLSQEISDLEVRAAMEQDVLRSRKEPTFATIRVGDTSYRVQRTTAALTKFLKDAKAMPVGTPAARKPATRMPSPTVVKESSNEELLARESIILGLQDPDYRKKLAKRLGEDRLTARENKVLAEEGVTREELGGGTTERYQTPTAVDDAEYLTAVEAGDMKKALSELPSQTDTTERAQSQNWGQLSPEQKYDDLSRNIQKRLSQMGASVRDTQDTQGMGARDLRLGTGATGIILQLPERGGLDIPALRRSIDSGTAPDTLASISPSGIVVTLGPKTVIDALESGDPDAANRYLDAALSEELIHAAHLAAIRETLGPEATTADVVAELSRTFDEAQSTLGDAEFQKLAYASIRAYWGDDTQFTEQLAWLDNFEVTDLPLDEAKQRLGEVGQASVITEMARQHMQMRRGEATTEEVRPAWVEKVAEWLNRALDIVRSYATNLEALGPRYAQQITKAEEILSELTTERDQSAPDLDAEYLAAVEAGDMAKAQELVDKAAREAGYDVGPVWHGSNAEFNEFDPSKTDDPNGFWFSANRDWAARHGLTRPYYIRNPKTFGGEDFVIPTDRTSDIKSADPVTYDDAGNVIPLSERFDSASPDIRYQAPARGLTQAEYDRHAELEARKGSLTEAELAEAQALVDKAAREAGYDTEAWHHGAFDVELDPVPSVGDEGMHFGTEQAARERAYGKIVDDFIREADIVYDEDLGAWFWQSQGVDSFDVVGEDGFSTEQEARNSMENFAQTQDEYAGDAESELGTMTHVFLRQGVGVTSVDQGASWKQAIADAKKQGAESISYRNLFEDKGSTSYVVFNPNQIKSAEPFTGVPLSQRFDPTNSDIRFQRLPQGAKGVAIKDGEQVILKGLKNPDFTTAVHEMMHGFEMTEYGDLTDAEVAQLKAWAGSKTEGRTMMERKASEKLARGWERYLAEGKAPVARLQRLFDKIAEWMLDTYKSLSASDLKVKISPEVRAIFDKIATRMENPSFIETSSGVTMETADGSPLPPVVTELPENPSDDQVVGYLRGLAEQPAPDLTSEDWNPDGLMSLQKRRSYEEAAEYKLDTTAWAEAARTFKDLWEQAINRPKGYGAALLQSLIAESNPDRVLTDAEIATLTHEGLRLKVKVDEANSAVAEAIKTGDKDTISNSMADLQAALADYQLLQDYAAASRRASGRSLNAWKYALRDDFSVARLQTRHLQDRELLGAGPMTDADRRAIEKYSATQLALQAEMKALQEASESERAELEERLAQAEAQIAALEDEAKSSRKRTAVQNVTKKLLVDKVRKSAAEARARLKSAGAIKPDPNERFQSPTPDSDPHWYDRALVLSEVLIANPAMSVAQFADRVRAMFGDAYAAVADKLFKDAHRQLRNTYADIAGVAVLTPAEVMENVGPETEITRELITELARAHVFDGASGFDVLTGVHADLQETHPDLTRDDVAQIFTQYGEQKPLSAKEDAKVLRNARSLELVLKQIQDLEQKGEMKKTGRTKDDPSPELRELRKKRDDLAKELGYTPVDPETQMSSAQSAAKKRMLNEIEELQGAIDSGNPRVRVRRGVDYTAEMNELKEKLDGLRKTYEETFGKERTPAEINARLLKDLDRRIAKEQDLINRGLLREPEAVRPLIAESEDVAARRAHLADLRQQKREAYERANPGETALKQAMEAAQKAVERRQAILDAGVPEIAGRGKRGDGVTPTAELQALWDAADTMDDMIREIRKARPETPARQQARLDAAYDAAIRTREALREKISKGDLSTAPAPDRKVDARLRAIREENAGLRKQLQQMRKDAGWGPFSQEAREARREAGLEKRLAEIMRKRNEKDYSTKPREEPVTNARIRQLQQEIDINKMQFEQDRAKEMFSQMSWKQWPKQREYITAFWMARQMINLTGDFGIFGRQLGKVRYRIVANDAVAAYKRLRKGEKLSLKDKALAVKTLVEGYKTFLDPERGERIYNDIVTDPRYLFRKKNGFRAAKPHETSHELTSEGRVRMNPLEVLNNRTIAVVMIGKGMVKTAVGLKLAAINPLAAMAAWPVIRNGVAETLGSTMTALLGVKFARRVEAAQTAMVNLARWGILDYVDVAAQNVDPRVRDEFYKNATSVDMVMSGKLAGKGTKWLADNAYTVGLGISFPQYNITNFMAAFGIPFFSRFSDQSGTKVAGLKYAAASYAYWLGGAAALRVVLAALLGVWDEDDDEVTHGVVMNPKHPKFGQIRVGNTFVNPDGGAMKWWAAYKRTASTTKLDPEMLRKYSIEIEKENTAYDRKQALQNFLLNQLNMNVQTALQYGLIKQNRDGVDLTKVGGLDYADMLLDDTVMNLALQQTFEVYEQHGLAEATALWSLLMSGVDVNVQESDADYAERKLENKLKEIR